jgi:hypothetical protein
MPMPGRALLRRRAMCPRPFNASLISGVDRPWARIKISRYRNRMRKVINAPIEVAAIRGFLFRAKPIPAAR